MLGSLVRPAGAGLAARGPEARGFSAVRTDPFGRSLGIAPARGGVTDRLFPGVGHRARSAQRGAFECPGFASHTASTGAAPLVEFPFPSPAFFQAGLATRPALNGRTQPAANTESTGLALLASPPASGARATAFCFGRFAAIGSPGKTGCRVPGPLPPAPIVPATGAEPAARLGFGAAAFRAQSGGHPFGGPAAGTGVLGSPGLRVPHVPDAGSSTFFGARAVGLAAPAPANLARAAPVHGPAAPASCAIATGDSIFNEAPVALAPTFVRIAPGHVESPVGCGVDQDAKRPAGVGDSGGVSAPLHTVAEHARRRPTDQLHPGAASERGTNDDLVVGGTHLPHRLE